MCRHACASCGQELLMYDDIRVVHSVFGSACYIDDSFPSMLYLAYKYSGR